jgi:hypothetical protein
VVGRGGFELDTVSMFETWTLYYLGELGELARRVPAMTEAATRGGNRHTSVTLRCAFPIAWLAKLSPDAIEADVVAALGSWDAGGAFQLQHMLALCSRVDLAIYRGEPAAMARTIAEEFPRCRRALLDRPPLQALLIRSTLARWAIAMGDIATAKKHVRAFRGLPVPLMAPCGKMFDGLFAEIAGDAAAAVAAYRACLVGLEATDTQLYAHAVRDRLGELTNDAALRERTSAWLVAEGVREPTRMLGMLLPRAAR